MWEDGSSAWGWPTAGALQWTRFLYQGLPRLVFPAWKAQQSSKRAPKAHRGKGHTHGHLGLEPC